MIQWPHLGLFGEFVVCEDDIVEGLNRNMFLLDVITQAAIKDFVSELPLMPVRGDAYILTADYLTFLENSIMVFDGDLWIEVVPKMGFIVMNNQDGEFYWFDGTGWLLLPFEAGDVVGPSASTDNALARFDGITGKIIQNSLATLSDVGILSSPGLSTSLLKGVVDDDSLTEGDNLPLPAPSALVINYTNPNLESISSYSDPADTSQANIHLIINNTGRDITFIYGSIYTPDGADFVLKDTAVMWIVYYSAGWRIIGGGGAGKGILDVPDITTRNAIPDAVRYPGLIVFVTGSGINYQLRGGITNANWVLLVPPVFYQYGSFDGPSVVASNSTVNLTEDTSHVVLVMKGSSAGTEEIASSFDINLSIAKSLTIIGGSDSDILLLKSMTLDSGNILLLNGDWSSRLGASITLIKVEGTSEITFVEQSRNNL